jgi:hypothetical protein
MPKSLSPRSRKWLYAVAIGVIDRAADLAARIDHLHVFVDLAAEAGVGTLAAWLLALAALLRILALFHTVSPSFPDGGVARVCFGNPLTRTIVPPRFFAAPEWAD